MTIILLGYTKIDLIVIEARLLTRKSLNRETLVCEMLFGLVAERSKTAVLAKDYPVGE